MKSLVDDGTHFNECCHYKFWIIHATHVKIVSVRSLPQLSLPAPQFTITNMCSFPLHTLRKWNVTTVFKSSIAKALVPNISKDNAITPVIPMEPARGSNVYYGMT